MRWVQCLALAVVATPLAAQTQPDVKPGEIIIIREVAPRNALIPGTGRPHTVDVAPKPTWFGPLETLGQQIDDQQAASIIGGVGGSSGVGAVPLASLAALAGGQSLTTVNGGAERASGGGLGGMISDTISGALEGALAALPGAGQP